jgi:hypothetical protein
MPTQSSGPISFLDLKNFLGTGTPTSFNEFYRAGTYVPDIVPNDHVPTTGAISMQEMYDTWINKTLSFTITVGSYTPSGGSKKGALYGYGVNIDSGTFGSISQGTFLTPNGVMTIEGLYFNTANHAWYLQLSSTASPSNSDSSFESVAVTGYSINGVRSAATASTTSGTARSWHWVVSSTSHPASGTIDCTINYYG